MWNRRSSASSANAGCGLGRRSPPGRPEPLRRSVAWESGNLGYVTQLNPGRRRRASRRGAKPGKTLILARTPMLWSIPIAVIAGTVVRVHITFLLFLVWIAGTHWRLGGQTAALDGVIFI